MSKLTNENYFSPEMALEYMSVSQYKEFMRCETEAMAALEGKVVKQDSTAILVGSYIDSYFEGTLEQFKEEHPEIISSRGATKGELKADYKHADVIIERIERDPLFMKYMSGQKQVIETAELFGCKWKIKIDSLNPDSIVDLKIMKDMFQVWCNGSKVSFIEAWGYDIQLAIYQKVHELVTGEHLPVYVCCATKEEVPDLAVIHIPDWRLEECLEEVEKHMPRILAVKNAEVEPSRCGRCNYCKETKLLTEPIDFQLVGMSADQIEMMQGTV